MTPEELRKELELKWLDVAEAQAQVRRLLDVQRETLVKISRTRDELREASESNERLDRDINQARHAVDVRKELFCDVYNEWHNAMEGAEK